MPTLPPIATYKPEPRYTWEARMKNVEGTVVVQVTIGTDGKPRNPVVERGLGYGLDESAVACVKAWRFQPARKNWVSYEVSMSVEMVFKLHPPDDYRPADSAGRLGYFDPDGAFVFVYPKLFIVHSDSGGTNSQGCIACLSYNRDLYKNYDFAGAEFWVDIPERRSATDDALQPITTDSECTGFVDASPEKAKHLTPQIIGGIRFTGVSWGGAAAGTSMEVELLRTFHNGKCYELGMQVSIVSTGYDDEDYTSGRIKHFTADDWQKVKKELQDVARTFRFKDQFKAESNTR